MKLTIDTDKLSDAAQWALRAIPDNPPIPAMVGIRLEATDNTLTLAGSDFYRSARAAENCEVLEPGTLLVPGRLLADIVKTLPKGKPTTLALDGTDLALSCGTAYILLPTLALHDYPILPAIPDASGTVDGATLAEAAARVAVAASTDEKRVHLTGVQFTLGGTTMVLSATDGRAFHVAHVPWTPHPAVKSEGTDKPRTEGSAVLPADVLRDAARILAGSDRAELAIAGTHFTVSVPGRWATGTILDVNFPQFPLPAEFESVATTGTETLADAIKHLQPLLGKDDPIVLDVTDDRITVRASADGKDRGRDQVDAGLKGEPLSIAFNPELLLKTLTQINGPLTQINFTNATGPAILHGVDQADLFRALVMPTRLR